MILLEFVIENFFTNWVEEPTWDEKNLDLFFTSENDIIEDISVGKVFGSSDSCCQFKCIMVYFTLKFSELFKRNWSNWKLKFKKKLTSRPSALLLGSWKHWLKMIWDHSGIFSQQTLRKSRWSSSQPWLSMWERIWNRNVCMAKLKMPWE